jgi:hypothetical protein
LAFAQLWECGGLFARSQHRSLRESHWTSSIVVCLPPVRERKFSDVYGCRWKSYGITLTKSTCLSGELVLANAEAAVLAPDWRRLELIQARRPFLALDIAAIVFAFLQTSIFALQDRATLEVVGMKIPTSTEMSQRVYEYVTRVPYLQSSSRHSTQSVVNHS